MPAWLGTIGGLVGLVVFFGAVVVYLRGSKDKGTIETLERSNHALTERVGLLEKDNGEMKARIGSLERENAALLAQRPSAEVLAEMRHDLTGYIASQRDHNGETRALLMAIAQTIGDRNGSD